MTSSTKPPSLNSPSLLITNRFGPGFIRPDYGQRCFAGVPETIARLLGCKRGDFAPLPEDTVQGGTKTVERVVVVLVDGFGWRFLERYQSLAPIAQTITGAQVACLTSQFPSTTSAHLSCFYTGLPVTESGIYEWFYHEPLAGRIIAPLLFNPARLKTDKRCELISQGILPEQLSPWPSFFELLNKNGGVNSYTYVSGSFADHQNFKYSSRGSNNRSIDCVEHGFSLLERDLGQEKKTPALHFLYLPEFDGTSHQYGPASSKLVECAERIFSLIEKLKLSLPPKTLLLVTADHGQTAVDPKTTVYLDNILPDLSSAIQIGSSGEPLVPAGSARDFFLHLVPERRAEIRERLKQQLRGVAEVFSLEEMIALGLLGQSPSARFLERIGDTVVLPHEGHTVWWSEKGRFSMDFLGHHGGLTADEMLIPLISFRS